jgi:hypothetical protein
MDMCIHRNDVLQIVDTAATVGTLGGHGNCDPDGKAMFTVIAALAELERSVVREGVRARTFMTREKVPPMSPESPALLREARRRATSLRHG